MRFAPGSVFAKLTMSNCLYHIAGKPTEIAPFRHKSCNVLTPPVFTPVRFVRMAIRVTRHRSCRTGAEDPNEDYENDWRINDSRSAVRAGTCARNLAKTQRILRSRR